MSSRFFFVVLVYVGVGLASSGDLPGVIQLDSWSFNKTIANFPFTLVKFDKGYPTGDQHKVCHHEKWNISTEHLINSAIYNTSFDISGLHKNSMIA